MHRISAKPLAALTIASLVLSPNKSFAEIEGVFEGDFATYNRSGIYSYGAKFGLSYQTSYGTHYLLGKAIRIEQDETKGFLGSELGVDSLGFGFTYRYGFSHFENFEPYVEYGWTDFTFTSDTEDPITGLPSQNKSTDSGDYLAVGMLYRLYDDIHLKAEVSYYGVLNEQSISSENSDPITGLSVFSQDTLNLSFSLGFSLKF